MIRDPLDGARVVVARAGDQAAPLLALLADLGAQGTAVPLVRTVPLDDPTPLDDALAALADGRYDWCVATSVRTVDALEARAEAGATPLAAAFAGTRVAAVGPATAARLAAAGVRAEVVPGSDHSAAGLLALLPAAAQKGSAERAESAGACVRVLLPQSAIAAPTLADGLRAAGWDVDVVTAYGTASRERLAPHERELLCADPGSGGAHALVLASPSAVSALLAQLAQVAQNAPSGARVRVGPAIVCLGPTTAAAARAAGLEVAAVATRATPGAVVDALREALTRENLSPRTDLPEETP